MLVYNDMAIGIPIGMLALVILVAAFYAGQSRIVLSGAYELHMLNLYDKSEELVSAITGTGSNYSQAAHLSASFASAYNLSVSLDPYTRSAACPQGEVCRIITVSGKLYSMVVK